MLERQFARHQQDQRLQQADIDAGDAAGADRDELLLLRGKLGRLLPRRSLPAHPAEAR